MSKRSPAVPVLLITVLFTLTITAAPPDASSFNIVPESDVFYEGDDAYLDCTIDGGTPLATLTWGLCVDQSRESSVSKNTATKSVQRLTILGIDRTYSFERCTCTASHPEMSTSPSLIKVLTVYYPPAVPDLLVDNSKGERLPWLDDPSFTGSLRCRVTPGNPDFTEITWYNNGEMDPYRSGEYRMFDPPDKIYNGRNFTCRAGNGFTWEKGTIVESNGIVLDIHYAPVITLNQSEAYINETLPFSLTCSAVGNPTPTVTWTDITDRDHVGPEAVLQFNSTDRKDTGLYFCYASSDSSTSFLSLSSTKTFSLLVQHGPDDVKLDMPGNTTENVTDIKLRCRANGLPANTFRWTHWIDAELVRDTFDHVTETQLSSTLTLPKLTYQDMGTYRCEVENGYKGRDGELVYSQSERLNVQARPRVIDAQAMYVVEKNDPLDVNITFHSFPKPLTVSITRPDSVLPAPDDLSIRNMTVPITLPFYTKHVTVDGYLVMLQFRSVQLHLEGHYQLFVNNTYPYFYSFQIIISDKPDPPQRLAIDTRSRNNDRAIVSWLPGNNGGHEQSFTVMYAKQNSGNFVSITTNHSFRSVRLENLQQFTTYDITIFASNLKGESEHVYGTFTTEGETSRDAAILGGAIGGTIAVLLIIGVIVTVICIYRRRDSHGINRSEYEMPKS